MKPSETIPVEVMYLSESSAIGKIYQPVKIIEKVSTGAKKEMLQDKHKELLLLISMKQFKICLMKEMIKVTKILDLESI